MKKLNSEFFDEFKKLEKILNHRYDDIHGVTRYIEDLKKFPAEKGCFRQLHRLRHIRNHLAHDSGAFNENCVTKDDILWLKKFYKRTLNGDDPLFRKKRINQKNWALIIFYVFLLFIISAVMALAVNSLKY